MSGNDEIILTTDEKNALVQLYLQHLKSLEERGMAGGTARQRAKELAAVEMSGLADVAYTSGHVAKALRLSMDDDLGVI